jgi:hypothetical protein
MGLQAFIVYRLKFSDPFKSIDSLNINRHCTRRRSGEELLRTLSLINCITLSELMKCVDPLMTPFVNLEAT